MDDAFEPSLSPEVAGLLPALICRDGHLVAIEGTAGHPVQILLATQGKLTGAGEARLGIRHELNVTDEEPEEVEGWAPELAAEIERQDARADSVDQMRPRHRVAWLRILVAEVEAGDGPVDPARVLEIAATAFRLWRSLQG